MSTLLPDVQIEYPSKWKKEIEHNRIKNFLEQCSEGKIGLGNEQKYPHLFRYARKHTLIKNNNNLDKAGIELKDILSKDPFDEVAIAEFLKNLLEKNKSGNGSWVVNEDAILNEEFYIFEARNSEDAAYEYAVFLVDLGILEEHKKWTWKDELYICKKTNLGRVLTKLLKRDFFKKINNSTVVLDESQNPVMVVSSVVGEVKGGKNNIR